MKQYQKMCRHILDNGNDRGDRTGTGTRSVFGYQMRFDLAEGFPLVTTKKTFFRGVVEELLWFLKGDTNASTLVRKNVHIWTRDAYRAYQEQMEGTEYSMTLEEFDHEMRKDHRFAEVYGDLGPIYGKQWRKWEGARSFHPDAEPRAIDQIAEVIKSLKEDPEGRRHIVIAWNVADLNDMTLPPCHVLFQFYVHDGKLSCQLYQRSVDSFLGLPFNIASYALLTMMIAQVTGLEPGEFIHTSGDAHIYNTHVEQVELQLSREPYPLPKMKLNPDVKDIDDFKIEDFELMDYVAHPSIKAEMSF